MIHKFRDMPPNLNTRSNIFVLIDEAHRTTGGDLGNYLMAGLPNATYIGFTGTPVDKTAYGKGTFKTFGADDEKGYLHKYSIAESIEDGTTLPLYYDLAPNEMLVPHETHGKGVLALAETEGIADIEELNRILDRAVNLKNFLKGEERVEKVAPLRRRALPRERRAAGLQGVPGRAWTARPAPSTRRRSTDPAARVFGGRLHRQQQRPAHTEEMAPRARREKQIRKSFTKVGECPKILIVTEKLLTGFDAPILYAMYLDKPMRDHTLLQAIARVNRPYENEAQEMVKPHGFVLDFVGIFDKLEKALAFDSDEINAIVKDLGLLKQLFKNKMETRRRSISGSSRQQLQRQGRRRPDRALPRQGAAQGVLQGVQGNRDALRDHLAGCVPAAVSSTTTPTLSSIYAVVRNAYTKQVYVDRAFQRKTNELVQKHVTLEPLAAVTDFVAIDAETIDLIKQKRAATTRRSST